MKVVFICTHGHRWTGRVPCVTEGTYSTCPKCMWRSRVVISGPDAEALMSDRPGGIRSMAVAEIERKTTLVAV